MTEKNGPVVALKGVYREGDVMLVTRNGIIIRSNVDKISIIGRNTQGVRLISLEEGDSLIDVAMCESDDNSGGDGKTEFLEADKTPGSDEHPSRENEQPKVEE